MFFITFYVCYEEFINRSKFNIIIKTPNLSNSLPQKKLPIIFSEKSEK